MGKLRLPHSFEERSKTMGLYEERVKRLREHVLRQRKKTEEQSKQEPNKDEIMAKLDELGIEYDKRANKATLLVLLEDAENKNSEDEGAE